MKKLFYLFLFAVLVFPSTVVYAAGPPAPGFGISVSPGAAGTAPTTLKSPGGIAKFFTDLVDWFAWFIALSAVVMGLYSGWLFITAGGDDKQIGDAKKYFVYTIIGVVVAVLAFSIVSIATSFTGL